MNKTITTLDASQITALTKCNYLWYLSYQRQLQKCNLDTEAWDKGTTIHLLMQHYNNKLWEGELPAKAATYAVCQVKKEDVPKTIDLDTLKQLKLRFLQYALNYEKIEKIATIEKDGVKKPATEVGFSEIIYEDDSNIFILEGRIDVILFLTPEMQIWRDYKTQSRRSNLYLAQTQFRCYDLVTKFPGQVDYFGLADKPDFRRSELIQFSSASREQWLRFLREQFDRVKFINDWTESEANLEFLAEEMQTGLGTSCTGDYGKPCQFHRICEETNPRIAESVIQIEYEQRKEKWEPWKLI